MIGISTWFKEFLKTVDLSMTDAEFIDQRYRLDAFDYYFSWGVKPRDLSVSLIETGFFKNSFHIDNFGLYQNSSFGIPVTKKIIENYDAPKSWKFFKEKGCLCPKFNQPAKQDSWDGIVVACQYPNDRSILSVGGKKDYYEFLEKVCKFFGPKALLKRHPVMTQNFDENKILDEICLKHGCEIGHFGPSVLKTCEFIYVYNSTYAIDAVSHEKHVFQYTDGYFASSGIVQFTDKKISANLKPLNHRYIDKFLDFLLWRYCIHYESSPKWVSQIFEDFSRSKEVFRLDENLSYGAFLNERLKQG